MSMRPQDLNFGGGDATESLLSPENQVPAPPILQTVEQIGQELADIKALYEDTKLGFGKTKLAQYTSQSQLDSAKTRAFKLINETIPQKLKLRKGWEQKYSAKRMQLGKDTELMSAQEVYDTQQLLKNATNTNDPELKAYDQAVAEVESLKTKFATAGTPESELTGAEQQLALAAAWKQVIPTITDKIKQLRAKNLPTVLGKYGDLGTLTNFVPVSDVEKNVGAAISEANKLAEVEFSTEQVEKTDKYGRPTSYTRLRDQEQSNMLSRFLDRSKKVATATPSEAAALVNVKVVAPTGPAAAKEGGTQNVVPAPVAPTVISPVATASQRGGRGLTQAESRAAATGRTLATPTGVMESVVGGGSGGGVPAKAKRDDVIAGLAALKLPDTAANRQTVRDQIKSGKLPGGGGAGGFDTGWQDRFKKEYPAYSWMLTELDQTKYADLFQLMNDAVKPGSEYTDELFQRKFIGTSWYTELAAGETGRALTTAVGSYSWGEGQLAKFLTTATRYGYKDATLKSKAYEALFAKDTATGNYINPAAIGEVKASSQFLAIKKIGTAFLSPVSDESVVNTLIGGKSSDDVLRVARESAKVKFPHLSNAIDAGVTLEDLGYQYQQNAAKLLEVAPNAIDMGSTIYAKAFGSSKDPMMSTGEWEAYLKGNPDAGWQYTKQANQQATDIGLTLARAFGKVQ